MKSDNPEARAFMLAIRDNFATESNPVEWKVTIDKGKVQSKGWIDRPVMKEFKCNIWQRQEKKK